MRCRTWYVELLGKLEAAQGEARLNRFRTRSAGHLLAYLALFPGRTHLREELAERFWPDVDSRDGRNRLKQDLASLRRQLEGPGVAAGSVLRADRSHLALNRDAFLTDVEGFQTKLRQAEKAGEGEERLHLLVEAVGLYGGELLPGCYADWVVPERQRLENDYFGALCALICGLEQAGKPHEAISYAHLALAANPLHEPTHGDLLRLYVATGQTPAAVRHYELVKITLQKQLHAAPSDPLRAVAETLLPRTLVRGCLPQPIPSRQPKSRSSVLPALLSQEPQISPHVPLTSSVPRLFTRFFGREQEIACLTDRLTPNAGTLTYGQPAEQPALVTLTGPGGSGKTRLALEVATRLHPTFGGAVWFVPLADISDPGLIVDRILQALNLPRSPENAPLVQISAKLARQPSLLVLDNFEHLVEEGAAVVRTLLKSVPTLLCFVTSRQCLSLEGEREFPVSPLPLPGLSQSLEQQMQCASVALFVDRAQAMRADFQLTPRNADAIAAICARLEGIPLALELAASRIGALTPNQMLAQLERRLDFLVSRRRDMETRHRTLRAAIAWSYDLLTPELQRFFSRLSVFRGGWFAEAAQVVCDVPDAVDLLEELRAHSLIVTSDTEAGLRFSMLEILREFGQEQLDEGENMRISRRHAEFYLTLANAAEPYTCGSAANIGLRNLPVELDNVRAALTWARDKGQGILGLRIASALRYFWWASGHIAEGCQWMEELLANATEADETLRARAYLVAGYLREEQGELGRALEYYERSMRLYEGLNDTWHCALLLARIGCIEGEWKQQPGVVTYAALQRALEAGRQAGNGHAVAFALDHLARLRGRSGEHVEGTALLTESLETYREVGAELDVGAVLGELGYLAASREDYRQASSYYSRMLTIARQWNAPPLIAHALWLSGRVAMMKGDYEEANALFEESLSLNRDLVARRGLADALANLGRVAECEGKYDKARTLCLESLELRRTIRFDIDIAHSLYQLGWSAYYVGEMATACSYFGESLALSRKIEWGQGQSIALVGLGTVSCCQGDLEVARQHFTGALALYSQRDDRSGVVFCLVHFTALLMAEGKVEATTRLLAAIDTWRKRLEMPPHAGEQAKCTQLLTAARQRLSDTVFDRAYAEGAAWTLEQAMTCALSTLPS